jgi:hypothetical protein
MTLTQLVTDPLSRSQPSIRFLSYPMAGDRASLPMARGFELQPAGGPYVSLIERHLQNSSSII